jgi:hypothetical protein
MKRSVVIPSLMTPISVNIHPIDSGLRQQDILHGDGKSRGKIGINQQRATGVLGSYDSDNKALTFLFCRVPETRSDYVNSSWEIQKDPFSGDVYNSYNDGPLADGSQMGPFYELETSSPAARLKPGESITHDQITVPSDRRRIHTSR